VSLQPHRLLGVYCKPCVFLLCEWGLARSFAITNGEYPSNIGVRNRWINVFEGGHVNSKNYVLLLVMALFVTSCEASAQSSVAITHVTVIDVVSGTAQPDVTVVVTGSVISAIAPTKELPVPNSARVVDAHGQFLIPGLWDMHVHLGNATEAALPVLVSYGITGVRDMGSPSYATLRGWSNEALLGTRIGPRIVACGPILHNGPPYFWGVEARTPTEAREVVRRLAEQNVDFIKVTSDIDRPTYFAIAEAARKLGLPLAGHLPTNENGTGFAVSAVEASNAGQKSLEHGHGIPFSFDDKDPQLISTLLRNGTWVDPTITTYWARAHVHELADKAAQDPRMKHIAPSFRQFWEAQLKDFGRNNEIQLKILEWRLAQISELKKSGVPLLTGTDLGFAYVFPGDLIKELEFFVQAGLSPLQALQVATIGAARFLHKDWELGTVETGKIADLVLLAANPLEDVHNLHLVRAVVLNGRFLDRAEIDAALPTFE
jgi:imidazolonepropionase-like amidohydrolase